MIHLWRIQMNSKDLETIAEAIVVEDITIEPNKEIARIIEDVKLNSTDSIVIHKAFDGIVAELDKWKEESLSIVVTDISQKEELKKAHAVRMKLKDMRLAAKRKVDDLLDDSKKYIKGVKKAYDFIETEIKPLEAHLQKQEDFEKEYKEKRREELRIARNELLSQFPLGVVSLTKAIEDYSESEFTKILQQAEAIHNQMEREAIVRERANKRMQHMLSTGALRLLPPDVDLKHVTEGIEDDVFNQLVKGVLEQERIKQEALAKERQEREEAARLEQQQSIKDAEERNKELLRLQQENIDLKQQAALAKPSLESIVQTSAQQVTQPQVAKVLDEMINIQLDVNVSTAQGDEEKLKQVAEQLLQLRNTVYTSDKWKEFGATINHQIDVVIMTIKSKV